MKFSLAFVYVVYFVILVLFVNLFDVLCLLFIYINKHPFHAKKKKKRKKERKKKKEKRKEEEEEINWKHNEIRLGVFFAS